MSTETGFYLAWLRLTGPQLEPAEVSFEPGLNVIWGASNSGKSFIFSCIEFMLGRDTPPEEITEAKGYTTGWLAFIERAGKKQWVLERDLKGGDFRLHPATGKQWTLATPATTIAAKASPDRSSTISHVLLSTIGMEMSKIMQPQSKGGTRNVSFRDLAHFTFVDETRIIAKKTPVYPTMQRDAVTPELSMFSFLVTGKDFTGMITAPDIKLEKASWRGKNELYEQLIADLMQEVGENPPSFQELAERVAAIDTRIEEVTSKIEESNKIVAKMMTTRKAAWDEAQKARSRMMIVEQLRGRFEQLLKQYKSDMERLQFISEGDFFLAQLGEPHCPFCGDPLDEHTAVQLQKEAAKGSIQDAAAEEAKKIAANVRDLEKTLSSLAGEQGQLGTLVTQRQKVISTTEKAIRQELEPRLGADRKELAELAETRSKVIAQQSAIERLAHLIDRHQALGGEPKKPRSSSAKATASPDAANLRRLADEIADVLRAWRYLKTGVVDFDTELDLVAAGEVRRNQGKGIRAVLHAAFTVALMNHCEKQKLRHSGLVMLDSPLTSYKEKDRYEADEDIQIGFFDSLSKLPDYQQVIVLENKEPPAEVRPKLRHTHFTGTPGMGREGFISERRATPSGGGLGEGAGYEGGEGEV